jgi:hypothetical protein
MEIVITIIEIMEIIKTEIQIKKIKNKVEKMMKTR